MNAVFSRRDFLFYTVGILWIIFCRLCFWTEPYGVSVDEATFMALAEASTHYGRIFVDAVDQKPPLLIALYQIFQRWVGVWNIHGIHAIALVWVILTCYGASRLVRRIDPDTPSSFGFLIPALMSGAGTREFVALKAEWLFLPFFLASLELLMVNRTLAATLLAAVTTLIKQIVALPYAVAWIAATLLSARSGGARGVLIRIGWVLIALSVVYGATVGLFFASGSLNEFLFWYVKVPLGYAQVASQTPESRWPIWPLLVLTLTWPVIALGAVVTLARPSPSRWILMAAIGGSLLALYATGRFFAHYFVPPAILFSVAAAPTLYRWRARRSVWIGLGVSIGVYFLLVNFREETIGSFRRFSFNRGIQRQVIEVSDFIRSRSDPRDRMVIWGMASQLYLISGRGAGSRFVFADFVSGRHCGFREPVRNSMPVALDWYLEDLEKKRPRFFVNTSPAGINDYSLFPLHEYPRVHEYIQTHYRLVATLHQFEIWERINP